MNQIGIRLRELRNSHGLTQRDLAAKLSVSPSTIALYELGQREPDIDMINQLAEFFHVSVDYLFGRDSTPSWWYRDTPPTDVELEEFLKINNIYFEGKPLSEHDKNEILTYIRVRWELERRDREKRKEGKKEGKEKEKSNS
ncbi:MAG: helix-turn-helix domain-containing protein [Firmicutes bacterium]|nr:helix-turn-helix domain-containing protein [Bacillota bacterium]